MKGIMGRRKIEIKMVRDTIIRQVTFSKRRTDLFKKANELSILCGAEVAIVVFSPGNKPYSFGHPDVDIVAAKFLQQEPKSSKGAQGGSFSNDTKLDKLNQELAGVMDQIREAVMKTDMYGKSPIEYDKTQREELQELHDSLAVLKHNIKERLDELEVFEAMLMLQEQPVEFNENHFAKRKRGRKN